MRSRSAHFNYVTSSTPSRNGIDVDRRKWVVLFIRKKKEKIKININCLNRIQMSKTVKKAMGIGDVIVFMIPIENNSNY